MCPMALAPTRLSRVFGLVPVVALMGLVTFIGHPLFSQTPLTHDHPTHLFKAWHFYEKFLPELQTRGFSFYWVFGHPAGELVPFGEEIWVCLFRVLTLGSLDWLQTYSLALFGVLTMIALSGYIFAKHFFGQLAGLMSGAFMVLDPGGWAQAGWYWCMEFGVWPNSLGVCFMLLSVVALDQLASRFSMRRFLAAVGAVGASIMMHQITLIFLPTFLLLLLLDRWVTQRLRSRALTNVAAAVLLGVGLSAFYVVPMLARSGLTIDLGVAGVPVGRVGARLVEGNFFIGMWPLLLPVGFLGAVVALHRRIPGSVFLTVGMGLFTLGSTDFPFSTLHLDALLPILTKIEAARILVGAKMLWFPLLGYGLSLALKLPLTKLKRFIAEPRVELQRTDGRWLIAWALGGLLLLPYLPFVATSFYFGQVQKVIPAEQVDHYQDLRKLWETTRELRLKQDMPYRVAYDLPMHDHIATLAPVFDDTWIYKVGYTPTQTFRQFPMYFDQTLFRKLMVKYVVSTRKLGSRDIRHMGTFGKLHLHELKSFDAKPFELLGKGKGELLELSPRRIRIRLSDTGPETRLQLFVSHLDHWQAKQKDARLSITQATIKGAEDPFLMEVPASDGIVEFTYEPRASDLWGRAWTFLTLLALAGWLIVRYPRKTRRPPPQLFAKATRRIQPLPAIFARRLGWKPRLVLLLTAALLFGGWAYARASSRTAFLTSDSLFHTVSASELKLDGESCAQAAPFDYRCGTKRLEARRVFGLYGTHLCFSAPGAQELIVTKRQTFGAALRGKYSVQKGPGRITVKAGEKQLGLVRTRDINQGQQFLRFDTSELKGKDEELQIRLSGAPLYCFDFSIEP